MFLNDLIDARLRRCLDRLEEEAQQNRSDARRFELGSQSRHVYFATAEAIEYAVAEIRAALGMEESDE